VIEAVDRVLAERQQLDRGYGRGLGVSAAAHVIVTIAIIVGSSLTAHPRLIVANAFAVALPPGGRGQPAPQEAAPAPPQPQTTQAAEAEPPAPDPKQILRPPKDEPKTGLPELDSDRKKPTKKERERYRPAPPNAGPTPRPEAPRTAGGQGTGAQAQGLSIGIVGPGAPGGTDPNGDWYLAGVQKKIWMLWMQQVRTSAFPEVVVEFTIRADGSLAGLPQVLQASGVYAIDSSAQRAISTAAPFSPLPRHYGTNSYTIRAIFKPQV